MTTRSDISWIDVDSDPAVIRRHILSTPHSFFPVCRGQFDTMLGVARAKDLIGDLARHGAIDLAGSVRAPIVMPESLTVLQTMEALKRSGGQLLLVADAYGTIQGLVTPIDILESIVGEFPDDDDEQPLVQALGQYRWRVDGTVALHHLRQTLHSEVLLAEGDDDTSLAGFLLKRFTMLPAAGQLLELGEFKFEVLEVLERRIATVLITRMVPT